MFFGRHLLSPLPHHLLTCSLSLASCTPMSSSTSPSAASRSSSAESFSAEETWFDDDRATTATPRCRRRRRSTTWAREEEGGFEALEALWVEPTRRGARKRPGTTSRRSGRGTSPRAERFGALTAGGIGQEEKVNCADFFCVLCFFFPPLFFLACLSSPTLPPHRARAGKEGRRSCSTFLSTEACSIVTFVPVSLLFYLLFCIGGGRTGAEGAEVSQARQKPGPAFACPGTRSKGGKKKRGEQESPPAEV